MGGGEKDEALITCVNWSPSFSLSLRRQGQRTAAGLHKKRDI